jgi:ribosomal protein S18 acetylase RimI-like enzyme
MSTSLVRLARPDELPLALSILLTVQPAEERPTRLAQALQLIDSGLLECHVVVVERQGQLVGAINCQPTAGEAGLIWPPVFQDESKRAEEEALLIRYACDWLRQQGARLVQCCLPISDCELGRPLLAQGFSRLGWLLSLRHDLQLSDQPQDWLVGYRLQTFTPDSRSDFQSTILETYEDTQDFPEMNGIRDIAAVLAGHQAAGRFDPSRWWLLYRDDKAVAVLLLNELYDGEWEIAYVGVVPQARRQGIARRLVRQGLQFARVEGASRVTLAVDERNHVAWHLYEQLGFRLYEQRQVFLWVAR